VSRAFQGLSDAGEPKAPGQAQEGHITNRIRSGGSIWRWLLSAALQLSLLWAAAAPVPQARLSASAAKIIEIQKAGEQAGQLERAHAEAEEAEEPVAVWAFYRKHTEKLLRRYLYASMQVGRSPNLLGESVGRGWVSSRKVRTFEDALIFVLDVERCLDRLNTVDRQLIQRIVLQEYTQTEAAELLGMSVRTIYVKLPKALDRLTERLVENDLLMLPA
jgi:RNA polymerase sigma factor (sigma-70 family)